MKQLLKPVLYAGLILTAGAAPAFVSPAAAQVVKGIGVVSLPAAVANSNAFKVAEQQRPVTYKAQIDQATTRRTAIAAQLQPLYTKLQNDQKANVATATLQQQAASIQQIEQSGQRELQTILQPVALSRAYVQEQIEDKLDQAVQNVAKRKNVQLILDASNGQVVFADAAYNMTQDVMNELNTLIPSAQLVPPAGWVPREIREQQQAAAAAQGQQAPAQTPANPQTNGR
jgi:Skp family chaperone for outer membrane proteins